MEHGPLPPHERTWRHPSELAAQERAVVRAESSPAVSRAFALTTGTLGLFAIALLVLTVTPSKQPSPIAVSATTAPDVLDQADAAGTRESTISAVRGTGPASLSGDRTIVALATPIGSGRYALVSQASLGDPVAARLDVALPSGRVTVGEIVERSTDAVLVALSDAEPGHEVAEQRPGDRDVVKVMTQPPVTIAFADVSTLEVAEGTAVVDAKGNLVGLCTKSGAGRRVRLIAVDHDMTTPDDDAPVADDELEQADDDDGDDRADTTEPATTATEPDVEAPTSRVATTTTSVPPSTSSDAEFDDSVDESTSVPEPSGDDSDD